MGSDSAPSCLKQKHVFWSKVWLVRVVVVARLRYRSSPSHTVPGEMKFPPPNVIVKSALSRTQPLVQCQPPATFDQIAFLGYRKSVAPPNSRRVLHAGAFIVRNGELATKLFDMWWRRRAPADWNPLGRIRDCPGCEQTELELMLKCRAKREPAVKGRRSATGETVRRKPAARQPPATSQPPAAKRRRSATGDAVRRKPATHQPQAASQLPAVPQPTEVVARGVFLQTQDEFCDHGRRSVGSTPFVHCAGNGMWTGTSRRSPNG